MFLSYGTQSKCQEKCPVLTLGRALQPAAVAGILACIRESPEALRSTHKISRNRSPL
jgi:hypothetical protein